MSALRPKPATLAVLAACLVQACTYRIEPPDVQYAATARCETALILERRAPIYSQPEASSERLYVIDLRRGARIAVAEIRRQSGRRRGSWPDFDRLEGDRYLLRGLHGSETRDACTGALLARESGPSVGRNTHQRHARSPQRSPFEARARWPDGEVWSIRGDRARRVVRGTQTYGLEDGTPGVLSTQMFSTEIVYDGEDALIMADPPSLLVAYRPQDHPAAPLLLARVTREGQVMWTVDAARAAAKPGADGVTLTDAHVTATGQLVLVVTDAADASVIGVDATSGRTTWRVTL